MKVWWCVLSLQRFQGYCYLHGGDRNSRYVHTLYVQLMADSLLAKHSCCLRLSCNILLVSEILPRPYAGTRFERPPAPVANVVICWHPIKPRIFFFGTYIDWWHWWTHVLGSPSMPEIDTMGLFDDTSRFDVWCFDCCCKVSWFAFIDMFVHSFHSGWVCTLIQTIVLFVLLY